MKNKIRIFAAALAAVTAAAGLHVAVSASADRAAETNMSVSTLSTALTEAAYMTGLERNSDVVVMSCYAPLLSREGEVDWTPDLIWFNDSTVYKTPSYYVQQMFAQACGTELIASETDGDLFQAVTRTETEVQVKAVNLSDQPVPLTVVLSGAENQTVRGQMLTGEKNHVNSFARPDKIVPTEITCECADEKTAIELPPFSLVILRYSF